MKKKNILGLALALALTLCAPALAGEAGPGPLSSQPPAVSTEPAPPESPAASPEPAPSESPAASPEPVPSEIPAASPEPLPVESPSASPEPAPSESPAASPEPVPSETPAASPEPLPAESPAASPEPLPAESPAASPEPVPSESPAVSPEPVPSESPAVSPAPLPAESPAVSPEPLPTESLPLPTETPLPSPLLQEAPTLRVTVPASGRVVVNPYGLRVETEAGESRAQVIHAPQFIKNESGTAVRVSAEITGRPQGRTVLVPAPPGGGEAGCALFLYLELLEVPDGLTPPDWAPGYTGAANQAVVPGGTARYDGLLTLGPGDVEPAWCAFRLSGSAAAAPEIPWSAGDTVDVTIAFTFAPA